MIETKNMGFFFKEIFWNFLGRRETTDKQCERLCGGWVSGSGVTVKGGTGGDAGTSRCVGGGKQGPVWPSGQSHSDSIRSVHSYWCIMLQG